MIIIPREGFRMLGNGVLALPNGEVSANPGIGNGLVVVVGHIGDEPY